MTMPLSSPITEHSPHEAGKEAIVLIDDQTLTQDCLAEAMRSAFPQTDVIGLPTIDRLPRPNGTNVALILMTIRTPSALRDELASHIRTIARYYPKAPVVVIAPCDNPANVELAMAAGAQGVIPVAASLKIAIAALQLVLAGGTYYPHAIDGPKPNISLREHRSRLAVEPPLYARAPEAGPLPGRHAAPHAEQPGQDEPANFMATFTAREADVLAALQKGRSNKWIAHHLNLSENTVKVHIRHIMRKLRATNRTEAVILSQHWLSDGTER